MSTTTTAWSPVEVHVASYSSHRMALPTEPLNRKRQSVWHSPPRNKAIAAIAGAITSANLQSLWSFGLFIAPKYTQANIPFLQPSWLTIVVESLEHAHELHQLLPGFGLRRAYPPQPTSWQAQEIVTLAALDGCGESFLPTTVINGVGGRFALDLPAMFDSRLPDHQAAIIELDDAFDDRAIHDTTRRLEQYGFRRWPVYPESRISFPPLAVPAKSKAAKSAYQRRAERWSASATSATAETTVQTKPGDLTRERKEVPVGHSHSNTECAPATRS